MANSKRDVPWPPEDTPLTNDSGLQWSYTSYVLVWHSENGVLRALKVASSIPTLHKYVKNRVPADERDDFRIWRPVWPWPRGLFEIGT